MAVQWKFKRNKEGKYLNGGGENEKRKEKIRKKKEDIKTMQREDQGHRRAWNCEIAAVNKGSERRCYISKYALTYGHTITIIAIKSCRHSLIDKFDLRSFYPLRSCGFFSNVFSPLMWVFQTLFWNTLIVLRVWLSQELGLMVMEIPLCKLANSGHVESATLSIC